MRRDDITRRGNSAEKRGNSDSKRFANGVSLPLKKRTTNRSHPHHYRFQHSPRNPQRFLNIPIILYSQTRACKIPWSQVVQSGEQLYVLGMNPFEDKILRIVTNVTKVLDGQSVLAHGVSTTQLGAKAKGPLACFRASNADTGYDVRILLAMHPIRKSEASASLSRPKIYQVQLRVPTQQQSAPV
mgnify:CR=1 FL=1